MPYSCSIAWPNCCPSCISEGRETDSPCLCSWAVGQSEGAERLNEKYGILSSVDKFVLAFFFFFSFKLVLCGVENIPMSELGFVRGNKG